MNEQPAVDAAIDLMHRMLEAPCTHVRESWKDAIRPVLVGLLTRSEPVKPEAVPAKPRAPWPDFLGQPIHQGDQIVHPTGEEGTVLYWRGETDDGDRWRVAYEDGTVSRLCLQIGDKGRAVIAHRLSTQEAAPALPTQEPYPITDAEQAALSLHCEKTEHDSVVRRLYAAAARAIGPQPAQERDRCALICDDFAAMMENGAGEGEPGALFRQAARKIRAGESPLGMSAFYAIQAQPASPAPVELTDEQIQALWDEHERHAWGKNLINPIVFARAVIAVSKDRS